MSLSLDSLVPRQLHYSLGPAAADHQRISTGAAEALLDVTGWYTTRSRLPSAKTADEFVGLTVLLLATVLGEPQSATVPLSVLAQHVPADVLQPALAWLSARQHLVVGRDHTVRVERRHRPRPGHQLVTQPDPHDVTPLDITEAILMGPNATAEVLHAMRLRLDAIDTDLLLIRGTLDLLLADVDHRRSVERASAQHDHDEDKACAE